MALTKRESRIRIRRRIRKKISGTKETPRLCVFRSNVHIYAQLVDDSEGYTLASASSKEKSILEQKGNKTEKASFVGKLLAERATEKGISQVRFDRSGYLYHGRIKSLAESARKTGLKF